MKHLLPFALFFFISWLGFSQDPAFAVIEGFEPKGILSKPSPYSLLKSDKNLVKESKVILISTIFLKSSEILDECSAHWSSNAVEIEVHGHDHDEFILRMLVFEKKYQVEFHWTTDVLPDTQIIVETNSSELKLSSDDFRKGSTHTGTVRYNGTCRGGECGDGKNLQLSGQFTFKIP